MRMDQYVGLPERATKWLEANVMKETTDTLVVSYVNGVETHRGKTTVIGPLATEYATIAGAWADTVAPLFRYKMFDGREVEEYVQAEPWSSGPMFFIALRYVGKTPCETGCTCEPSLESLAWTEEEIRAETTGEEITVTVGDET